MTQQEQLSILEHWLALHKGILFKVIRSFADGNMDQDDLFQEILIQVWHSIPVFRQESAVTTWLYRIALNTAIKWNRKESRHLHPHSMDQLQHVLQDSDAHTDQRVDWLYEEISRLDKIDRSIALLLLEGFSYREMAAICGITESNLGTKIHRIKKQLILKAKKLNYHGI